MNMADNNLVSTTSSNGKNSRLGKIFLSFLDTIDSNFYDPTALTLVKQIASSSPSPTDVEVAFGLLSAWTATGLTLPKPIPPAHALRFPVDHGQHWNVPVEWHFLTLSLNLESGGRISAVIIIFRKAIAMAVCAPKRTTDLDWQIFSTSFGVTVQMPGKKPIHYSFPVVTRAGVEGGVKYSNNPFHLKVGKYSINGSADMFPLCLHAEGTGDSSAGRPAIEIDVDCSDTNPLFLQGSNGYVGTADATSPSYYYYSWPNQSTTGTVTIDGKSYNVKSGLTWMDHQWGGYPVPSAPESPGWSGWGWFQFQFDGNRALTLACPQTGGTVPAGAWGFGNYIDGDTSIFVTTSLTVSRYTKSTETDAKYPSEWQFSVTSEESGVVKLDVTATTVLEQQALWQGGLTEYAEAASTAKARGYVNGEPVTMKGVGYCESVGFEDPSEVLTRCKTWLHSSLQKYEAD